MKSPHYYFNRALEKIADRLLLHSSLFRRLEARLDNVAYEIGRDMRHSLPRVLSAEDTLAQLLENGSSLARFGDGEFRLIRGGAGGIGFQADNAELGERLATILRAENLPENLLVAIPNVFGALERFKPEVADYWRGILVRDRTYIESLLRPGHVYGDSLLTRCYMDLRDSSMAFAKFETLKRLWAGRDVVLIEGEHTRFGVSNDLLAGARMVRRILCPAKGAYSVYPQILESAAAENPSALYLAALGPTATVLSYDLSGQGRQIIDIGHLDIEYEWMRRGATRKISIAGKAVNEIGHDPSPYSLSNGAYTNQIAKRITT